MDSSQLHQENKELKIINAIAHQLNREVGLQAALKNSLQHTVELLGLNTGWIWLVHQQTQSVYLAASHNLPPAFTQQPEKLSGWCWCIEKYLTDRMDTTVNISEISCSRLKDLEHGTAGLRYHASVPLFSGREKIGIMNVLTSESRQMTETKLQLLHTIGDLLSMSVQRAQLFEESKTQGAREERRRLSRGLGEHILPTIDRLLIKLQAAQLPHLKEDIQSITQSLRESEQLADHLLTAVQEMQDTLKDMAATEAQPATPLRYPGPPLSSREKEVLTQLQSGKTNKQIADELFISERTVKFHVSAILQKLDAANRMEAVQVAMQRGVLSV
ncbi:MAG: LuxR C-terminal-related transcriptional regulator [Saprospiraceae bacterium]|nr:GAF domain-containing protein [Lewinella sp.]